MIEELVMATLMSIAFALPVYYICDLHGSFVLVWLVWLVSLADGIGAPRHRPCHHLRCSHLGWHCLRGAAALLAPWLPCAGLRRRSYDATGLRSSWRAWDMMLGPRW